MYSVNSGSLAARRRAKKEEAKDELNSSSSSTDGVTIKFPKIWTGTGNENLVEVEPSSAEFKCIIEYLNTFFSQNQITVDRIHRVQNPALYAMYHTKRASIKQKRGTVTNEIRLFHGCKEGMIQYLLDGFNAGHAAKGSSFGEGIYFATDPRLSNGFACSLTCNLKFNQCHGKCSSNKRIIIARVACGTLESVADNQIKDKNRWKITRMPPHFDAYDSVLDDRRKCEVVVFENSQAYPEYLVEYTCPVPLGDPYARTISLKPFDFAKQNQKIILKNLEPLLG